MSCELCVEFPGWVNADGARCRCPNGCSAEWKVKFDRYIEKEENMNTFPIKPLADRIVVKMFEKEETTKSGLVLPQGSTKFKTAEVIAVGRGTMFNGNLIPPEVNVGDIVHLTAHQGDEITVDDQKYVLVTERVIVAVVGKKDQAGCCQEKKVVKGAVLSESTPPVKTKFN